MYIHSVLLSYITADGGTILRMTDPSTMSSVYNQ